MTRRVLLWAPVLAYMAFIFVLSSMPDVPLPSDVSDKSAHMTGYIVLGLLAVRAVHGGLPVRITLRGALLAMLITAGYGASDELHQWFVPGRTADVFDLLADTSGGAIAVVLCWAWGILWLRQHD